MGSDEYPEEKPKHRVHLESFRISRTPITNAQYHLFIQASDRRPPDGWEEANPPRGEEATR